MNDPAPTSDDAATVEVLKTLAGTVHTYESLGRSIVADALAQAAAGGLDGGGLTASVTVRPARRPERVDPPPTGGAAGHYEETCTQIFIVIGDGPAHEIRICWP